MEKFGKEIGKYDNNNAIRILIPLDKNNVAESRIPNVIWFLLSATVRNGEVVAMKKLIDIDQFEEFNKEVDALRYYII